MCFHLHLCICQSVSAINQNANMTAESPSHPIILPTVMRWDPSDDLIGKWNSINLTTATNNNNNSSYLPSPLPGTVLKSKIFTCINSFTLTTTLWGRFFIIFPILTMRKLRVKLQALEPEYSDSRDCFLIFTLAKLKCISIYSRSRGLAFLHYA